MYRGYVVCECEFIEKKKFRKELIKKSVLGSVLLIYLK